MSDIKNGFNNKPSSIRIYGRDNDSAEVWIEQEGLHAKQVRAYQRSETLSYATLQEIIALRDECNEAIKKMTGVKTNDQ